MDLLFRNDEIVSFFGTSPVMAASIRVTKRCNLQCIHCYADSRRRRKDKDELSTKEVFDVIDQLSELSINEIFFYRRRTPLETGYSRHPPVTLRQKA